jgi:hypothetical protein
VMRVDQTKLLQKSLVTLFQAAFCGYADQEILIRSGLLRAKTAPLFLKSRYLV